MFFFFFNFLNKDFCFFIDFFYFNLAFVIFLIDLSRTPISENKDAFAHRRLSPKISLIPPINLPISFFLSYIFN